MRYTLPQNTFKKNLVALSVVTALSFLNANVYAEDLTLDDRPDKTLQKFEDGNSHTYDSLYLSHTPSITNSQFSIDIRNGSTLSVSGTTKINLNATEYDTDSYHQGTHALHIEGKGSKLNLTGDINIFVSQKAENHTIPQIGASSIYADEGAEVKLGNANSTTKIWTFADKPDNISVKGGASLTFVSTNNQIVGDFDLLELTIQTNATEPSRLTAVFDGSQSYWVGDLLDNDYPFNFFHETDVDLTFQNGAQWIYMDYGSISSITLNQGGIINLYDENIHRFWYQIGLPG